MSFKSKRLPYLLIIYHIKHIFNSNFVIIFQKLVCLLVIHDYRLKEIMTKYGKGIFNDDSNEN